LLCRKHPVSSPSPERAKEDSPGSGCAAAATPGNDPNKPTFSSFAPVKANDEKASRTRDDLFYEAKFPPKRVKKPTRFIFSASLSARGEEFSWNFSDAGL
jgi:hypothetical protein